MIFLSFILIALQAFAAELNFTITAPDGWTKKDKSSALAQYQKGGNSFIITADLMPADAKTPDEYITFVKSKLEGVFKKITFETIISDKKDGYVTRELKYTAETSGIKMKYDVLYIFNKGKAYTLTAGAIDFLYDDKFVADVKAMFSSFKFKE